MLFLADILGRSWLVMDTDDMTIEYTTVDEVRKLYSLGLSLDNVSECVLNDYKLGMCIKRMKSVWYDSVIVREQESYWIHGNTGMYYYDNIPVVYFSDEYAIYIGNERGMMVYHYVWVHGKLYKMHTDFKKIYINNVEVGNYSDGDVYYVGYNRESNSVILNYDDIILAFSKNGAYHHVTALCWSEGKHVVGGIDKSVKECKLLFFKLNV